MHKSPRHCQLIWKIAFQNYERTGGHKGDHEEKSVVKNVDVTTDLQIIAERV